jgi:replicative DNA helicase
VAQVLPQTDRLYDKAAEAAVLASMVLDPRCIPQLLSVLDSPCFFFPEHQAVFEAILNVWRRVGFAVDGVLLRGELDRLGQLGQIGGAEYLQAMMDTTPTAANAVYYAGRVAERRRYRELVTAQAEIAKVIEEPEEVEEQVRKVQEIALGLHGTDLGESIYPVSEHATRVAVATQDRTSFLPTGLRNIDWYIGGLMPGRLIIAAGRPSMGKTALAVTIALNLAQAGKRVLFFTLEMTADELMERMISVLSRVNLLSVKRSDCGQATLDLFYGGALDLSKLPIVIEEGRHTVEQQIAALRHQVKSGGVDLVVVDYLGLMSTGRRIDNRVQEVSTISRNLKLATVREHVPILALSQLNRECEARDNHRPHLSDLRDSGSLEQDADVVMLLHREDYYRRQKDPNKKDVDGTTECIIAKQRGGPCGVAKLIFVEETTLFGDCARDGTSGGRT